MNHQSYIIMQINNITQQLPDGSMVDSTHTVFCRGMDDGIEKEIINKLIMIITTGHTLTDTSTFKPNPHHTMFYDK